MEASTADKGIKGVGIFSLITFGLIMWVQDYIQFWLTLIGIGYLYFSTLKFKDDKANGKSTDRATAFILLGSVMIVFGVSMIMAVNVIGY
jgi:uncharacterized membrane protein